MIQVLGRAFKILDFVAGNPGNPKTMGAIASYAGLNTGTCANIVKTLCEHDFLEQAPGKKGYVLGPRVYYLARNGVYRKDIVDAAEVPVSRLASLVQETVLVATMHRGKRSVLLEVNGNRVLNVRKDFLLLENIYNTATGRLLLAFLPPAELEIFINGKGLPDRGTWPEAATRKKLEKCISEIRRQGMVVHYTGSDVAGIAFPIKQQDSTVAALGLFLPAFRFKGRHRHLVMAKMKDTALEISLELTNR